MDGGSDFLHKDVPRHGFPHPVAHSLLDNSFKEFCVVGPAAHDNRDGRVMFLEVGDEIHSVAVGHGQVADHGADFTRQHRLVHQLFCAVAVRSQPDFIALPTERHAGGFSNVGIVVDDQDGSVCHVALPPSFECVSRLAAGRLHSAPLLSGGLFMGRLFSSQPCSQVLIPLLLPDQVQNKEDKDGHESVGGD